MWVDAHGDLNTPETTPSGFLGGMPFAILLGWCHDELRTAAGLDPALPEERAALVGARDLDPGERDAIARSRLVVADDVAAALAGLPDDAPLHVHLDGDVLDPEDAPGVDFPAPGGWRLPHLVDEMAALAATGRVVGVSLCCGNPRRDPEGRSAAAYARALEPVLGRRSRLRHSRVTAVCAIPGTASAPVTLPRLPCDCARRTDAGVRRGCVSSVCRGPTLVPDPVHFPAHG